VLSRVLVDPDIAPVSDVVDRHDGGWYTLRPNLEGVVMGWGETRYTVRSDSHGFRINDVQVPGAGTAKFIFLGDSFTFGILGPWEDTFVGMFEERVRPAGGVVNAGMFSYSPTAYVHQYQKALSTKVLRRDHHVIVGIDISDVQDEAAVWDDGKSHPRHRTEIEQILKRMEKEQAPQHTPEPSALRKFLASNFIATKMIYRSLRYGSGQHNNFKQPDVPNFESRRSAFTWKDWVELGPDPRSHSVHERLGYLPLGVAGGLARIRSKIGVLSDLVAKNGGRLSILIYPWPAQLKYGQRIFDWETFNRDLCSQIKCSGVINTFPEFKSKMSADSDWYSRYFIVGDVHFNKDGNRVIADELVKTFATAE
jgi:hypothetical protein